MKIAIITGGSRGLGLALMNEFKNYGYTVVEFSRSGASMENVNCDFKHYQQAADVVENTLSQLAQEEYSEIILVNNAGTIHPIGPVSAFSPSEYQKSININFLSSIMVTGIFTKYFQPHQCIKTIIAISSGAAIKPKFGWSLYCGAKAGIEQFFRSFSLEQSAS